jgi:hypothetical protein
MIIHLPMTYMDGILPSRENKLALVDPRGIPPTVVPEPIEGTELGL